jgi:hypothetical protein
MKRSSVPKRGRKKGNKSSLREKNINHPVGVLIFVLLEITSLSVVTANR